MTKCEKCKDAILHMDEKPQKIECTILGKTYMYGQRINCPKDNDKRK